MKVSAIPLAKVNTRTGARLKFDVQITQNANGKPVVRGYTIHAFADADGKPIRPPAWFLEMLEQAAGKAVIKFFK